MQTTSSALIDAPPPERTEHIPAGSLPLLLYGLTGFAGILAEQSFERYLSLLVGATAAASAVVIFTYFLGFALGGVVAGRMLGKGRLRRPLRAYGVIELFVGIGCVAFTFGFHPITEYLAPWQGAFSSVVAKQLVRFAYGSCLLLPIAALMGASFPLIAQAVSTASEQKWTSAYASNLAGAFVAALLAPYAVMPYLGLRGAMWLCFGICAVVCGVTWFQPEERATGRAEHEFEDSRVRVNRPILLLLIASFVSGLVFFALEVIWTHLIGAILGCSVYAFSAMLSMVLLGLLIGAAMVNRGIRSGSSANYPVLFLACAFLLLIQFRLWDIAPVFFGGSPAPIFQNFYVIEAYKLYVAGVLVVPGAALLGTIYPRLLASAVLRAEGNGWLAGYMSAFNSLGCLMGALLATFVLVPLIGSETSIKAIIVAIAACSLLFWMEESRSLHPRRPGLALAVAAVIGLALYCHWNWQRLTAGTGFSFGSRISKTAGRKIQWKPATMIFRHEDIQGGITTVVEQTVPVGGRERTIRTMFTDGKFQGDDNPEGEQEAQFGFAAIPSLFVGNFDRVLLIGLGTGDSAKALRHVGFKHVDVAEFSPGIVQAASQYFKHLNEGILSDRNVALHLEDGRNVLLTDPSTRYDLITIEVTSIWFAGATNVYSEEFYELARRRLRRGGVLQQWIQLHHISPMEIASAIATARAVFPYVGYWCYGLQGMLVASERPLVVEPGRNAALGERLRGVDHVSAERADELIQGLSRARLLGPEGAERLIRILHPPHNTDHNRWIEYSTPTYYASDYDWWKHNFDYLARVNAEALGQTPVRAALTR